MRVPALLALPLAFTAFAQSPPAWVARSNQTTQLLINLDFKYSPESASEEGVAKFDEQISTVSADEPERLRGDLRKVKAEFERRRAQERDPLVKQDLDILIGAVDRRIRLSEANEKTFIPYLDVANAVFGGVKPLLDEQTAAARHPAAVVRLRKYTGMTPGFTPLFEQAESRWREKAKDSGLLGPSKILVEENLRNTNTYIDGIGLLLEKYKVPGYEPVLAKLREQIGSYGDFVRSEVLPRARADFRLPPAIYALRLETYGVDFTPAELERMAHQSFTEIQGQMQEVAARVAKERGFASADYRSVIRELKKEQFKGDEILPQYQRRLAEIEDILRKNNLITLPARPAIIKLASAAETAQQPAPHMQPAPLLNNHGERGAFILPMGTSGANGDALRYDDFTFPAASWTLISHEARPGHELQFDAMIEQGVSIARANYAFNSTNAEGWGLYSEWFMLPYMPDDGKLISLQLRLQRAARAFLDPELQEGKVTPEQAMQLLQNEVVLSKAFATEEVDRFTFRMPGQAVSYFDGLTRLLEIRAATEKALGPKFNVKKFHDFILSQGLLPPTLLRKAVMDDFIPKQ